MRWVHRSRDQPSLCSGSLSPLPPAVSYSSLHHGLFCLFSGPLHRLLPLPRTHVPSVLHPSLRQCLRGASLSTGAKVGPFVPTLVPVRSPCLAVNRPTWAVDTRQVEPCLGTSGTAHPCFSVPSYLLRAGLDKARGALAGPAPQVLWYHYRL